MKLCNSFKIWIPIILWPYRKMAFQCNLATTLQICSVVAGIFTIVMGIVFFFDFNGFAGIIVNLFLIIFGLLVCLAELYVFDFFKYLGFLLTFWGKTVFYIYLGFLVFASGGIRLVTSIIFWVLAIIMVICHFLVGGVASPPLFQTGGVSFSASNSDYFEA